MTLVVEVWERDQTTPGPPTFVADITEAWGRKFHVAKNDYGYGALNVQLSDPELAELQPGRLVRFVRDGVTRQSAVLGPRVIKKVTRGGQFEQVLVVQAPGVLHVLNDAPVQFPYGPGWQPWDRQRRWDWSNPALDVSGWVAATQLWQQGTYGDPTLTSSGYVEMLYDQGRFPFNPPDGCIDGAAWWIWSSGYEGSPGTSGSGTLHMPLGVSYFHKTFTVDHDVRARIIAAADDFFEVAIDGVVLMTTAPAPEEAHSRARTRDVLLTAGTHTIRVKCENFPRLLEIGNIAGLILAIHEVNVATDAAEAVLVRTDSSWVALDYPEDPPGFTLGQINLELLGEIQAAGFLTDVVPTFDADLDSDGTAFPVVSDVVTTNGVLYGDQVKGMCEVHIDTRLNADLTWDLWVKGTFGTSTAVEFEVDVNIGEMEFDGDQTPVSSLLVLHEEGPAVLGDATAGRQRFVDLSSLPAGQALEQGAAMLTDLSSERWAVSIAVDPAGGDVPLDDFDILDLVTVPTPSGGTDLVECIAISWTEDAAGNDILGAEFGDVVLTVEDRRQQLLDRASVGALGGRSTIPPTTGTGDSFTPAGSGGGGFAPIAQQQPIIFERAPEVTEVTSWEFPVTVSGSVFEVGVKLAEAQPGDVDVDVELDGTAFVTVTVPAGQTYLTAGGLSTPVAKDSSQLSVSCADLGFYLQVTVRVS